ncbi:hypothetical protein H112_08767 [Trichophyton rubrum D6]|uniref:Uncharacterized protein n=2 Tax=Trichophyton rubrum TaxID=5551 RepID=A0A080WIU9_TRIRC|nr:uncharacterized protein TERG_11701 [Trichophyton rubrum CBS 118892]EZF09895.1 hypothetical protein H100_08788 [Trichophyton rubrum MR850]EZF36748.1 hypothetical protein H102_08748 [Trichophyton rubrum CBS 100081]EZF47495.1 hypothetical protein H103_08770 [Trichophyton rubrum CBS 288.86]EZF58154.1 hypothetical protein H104_08723 [Trichophyton rubrum CBS 289.86]EZF79318.1 hypothetical protein H110_08772 [Trichophyton rubrum MR1448]EZF90211.1 hypothetical protein H113_08840 [Trichophyton rubr
MIRELNCWVNQPAHPSNLLGRTYLYPWRRRIDFHDSRKTEAGSQYACARQPMRQRLVHLFDPSAHLYLLTEYIHICRLRPLTWGGIHVKDRGQTGSKNKSSISETKKMVIVHEYRNQIQS